MGFEDGGTEGYFKAVGGALSRLGFMFYMLHDALLSYALYSTLFFLLSLPKCTLRFLFLQDLTWHIIARIGGVLLDWVPLSNKELSYP